MASGSQTLTTYYAKRIIGDNAAANASSALLQTGARTAAQNSTIDTWIFGDTNVNSDYGILHSNGTKYYLTVVGAGTNVFKVNMSTGDTYIIGKVGINYDPETTGNAYQFYVNGLTAHNGNIEILNENYLIFRSNQFTRGTNPSTAHTVTFFQAYDKSSTALLLADQDLTVDTSGVVKYQLRAYNWKSSSAQSIYLCFSINKDTIPVRTLQTNADFVAGESDSTHNYKISAVSSSGTVSLFSNGGGTDCGLWFDSHTSGGTGYAVITNNSSDVTTFKLRNTDGSFVTIVTDANGADTTRNWTLPVTDGNRYFIGTSSSSYTQYKMLYASSTSDIINTSNLYYIPEQNAELGTTKGKVNGLFIVGTCYGNTQANLGSNIVNVFRYGDPGPQIRFSTEVGSSLAGAASSGAIIWTNHSTSIGTESTFHFVGKTSSTYDATTGVVSHILIAKSKVAIGVNYAQTDTLHVEGSSYLKGSTKTQAIYPEADAATTEYNIGTSSTRYNNYWAKGGYYVSAATTYTGMNSVTAAGAALKPGYIEMTGDTNAYIDFKSTNSDYNDLTDYNVRIVNDLPGRIRIASATRTVDGETVSAALENTTVNGTTLSTALYTTGGGIGTGYNIYTSGSFLSLATHKSDDETTITNNGGYRIYVDNQQYGQFYPSTIGTTSQTGIATLSLGNANSSGTNKNARGQITIYGNNNKSVRIRSITDDYTDNRYFYIPNYDGNMYAVHNAGSAVGSVIRPVYVTATGRVTQCDFYGSKQTSQDQLVGLWVKAADSPHSSVSSYASDVVGIIIKPNGLFAYNGTEATTIWSWSKDSNDKWHADVATTWATARTLTIGATGKSVNGSANVSWSTTEILGSSSASAFYRGDKTWTNVIENHLWAGTTSTSSERDIGAQALAGKIYLYSAGSATGNRGIYCSNNAGTSAGVLTFNQSNWITSIMPLNCNITVRASSAKGAASGPSFYIMLYDNQGTTTSNRLGIMSYCFVSSSLTHTRMYAYDNISGSEGATYFGIYMTSNTSGIRRTETNARIYGAVWNDYAEYRASTKDMEPGHVLIEHEDGIMRLADGRLLPACRVYSDTFGMAIGQTEKDNTPIAVSGRVLVYPYRNRKDYELGAAVCSAPGGTVDMMTREEIMMYPERIIGVVSEIPDYETWECGYNDDESDPMNKGISKNRHLVPVNGRIWIYVK